MRIATQTIYNDQTASIDDLVSQQQHFGQEASSGKSVTMPSDDPTHIAQDLSLGTTIGVENSTVTNINNASAELNTVDSALSSVTSIMQKAREIAVEGASDTLTTTQRQALGKQVDGLLTEAVGVANTNYAGKYVFAGTVAPSSPPVTTSGSPISTINFAGNQQVESQDYNGQNIALSTTMQAAFNFQSADGSPDVFQSLITLRDTLNKGIPDNTSAAALNVSGTVINNATVLNSPNFSTPLATDNGVPARVSINISSGAGNATLTFDPTVDTVGTVIAAINGAGLGVTASFNAKTEKFTLSSNNGAPFRIDDTATTANGATNTGNFVAAFGLTNQADVVGNISRQIGDIDHALNTVLRARSVVGGNIQTISAIQSQTSTSVVNNTAVKAGIEDADIAKVISQFSQTQTALQAAYATTTRLESKTLFDFVQ